LVGKPEGKRPRRKPTRCRDDNSKTDLIEIGCGGMNWIHLAEDRKRWRVLSNTAMNLRIS
jgi:hypothetical protein